MSEIRESVYRFVMCVCEIGSALCDVCIHVLSVVCVRNSVCCAMCAVRCVQCAVRAMCGACDARSVLFSHDSGWFLLERWPIAL